MAGKTIRILEKTLYDHVTDSLPVSPASAKIWVATNIPIDGYVYGALVTRVHSCTALVSGSPIVSLSAYPSAPTAEDPAATFRGANAVLDGSTNGAITLALNMAPTMKVFGQNMALYTTYMAGSQFVDVQMTVVQGAANQPVTFTISADLVLRS